ncbi:PREDICTED: tRNA-splicing endonuclease subunit Sen54-like [Priapulus caudatus]|uniref:tRNA-splicing endonuclease subunit Sen54-like n=1 Tax=Priapulus caudatus TaxID=37621 RepID=A0ABM1DNG8_PRICU|nr:PREDICTED: tRNA-splicing endonuclease subunit Sen54-like [Priapulus caudatus]
MAHIRELEGVMHGPRILSAEELSAHRSERHHNRVLPDRGGAKDSLPDDSLMHAQRLQQAQTEMKVLLEDERVNKVLNLSQGTWDPKAQLVEVTKCTGKFSKHFGHVGNNGKMVLQPEEALFLIDTGDMEVCFNDVPMSLQEAYLHILPTTAALNRYFVYGHLSRLGFIVLPHQGKSSFTRYERHIRLDQHVKEKKTTRPLCIDCDGNEAADSSEHSISSQAENFDVKQVEILSSDEINKKKQKLTSVRANTEVCHTDTLSTPPKTYIKQIESIKKFSSIYVPDLGTLVGSRLTMPIPDVNLLPRNTLVTAETCTLNMGRLEVERQKRFSRTCTRHDVRMHRNRCSLCLSDERFSTARGKPSHRREEIMAQPSKEISQCNRQPPVLVGCDFREENQSCMNKSKLVTHFQANNLPYDTCVNPTNWKQYKIQKLKKSTVIDVKESEANHQLKRFGCFPLVRSTTQNSIEDILVSLDKVKSITPDFKKIESVPFKVKNIAVDFDVYLPSQRFKKSSPGLPIHRICVRSHEQPLPSLLQLSRLQSSLADDVPIQWAVVDGGHVCFYSLHGIIVPSLDVSN